MAKKKKAPTASKSLITLKQDSSPMVAMQVAINAGVDIDKLEKLLALQTKWEEREAKKAYVQAMADFKSKAPKIIKDSRVKYDHKEGGGKTEYDYATLGNVVEKISAALSENGLSAAWSTQQDNSQITVTCTITHRMGHSENTSLFGSPDLSGKKNAIQAMGSTISYLQRYTLLSLTGLATHDQDNDGQGAPAATIEEKKRSRAARAKYNKKLQAAQTLEVYENIAREFRKLFGSFEYYTHHNDTEKFTDLFNEHKARIDRIVTVNAKAERLEDWKRECENCLTPQDLDSFKKLEDEFIENKDDWDIQENRNVIDSAGEKVGAPGYF